MSKKPLLLDLYCCAGGAAMGYHQAGFEVIGVDIAHQKNYPFTFCQGRHVKMASRALIAFLLRSDEK